jgi:hypothetical protein
MFRPERNEVTKGWKKLHSEELHRSYISPNIIRPASHRGGSGSFPVQAIRDLCWAKWHWDRYFSPSPSVSPVNIIPLLLHIHSYIMWGMDNGPSSTERQSHPIVTIRNIRMLKSRRMRCAEHVARMWEMRNAYKLLVGNSEGKRLLG